MAHPIAQDLLSKGGPIGWGPIKTHCTKMHSVAASRRLKLRGVLRSACDKAKGKNMPFPREGHFLYPENPYPSVEGVMMHPLYQEGGLKEHLHNKWSC